jgi:EAL and modified HD-GYP domain-containing signal transduction protein
MTTEALTVNHSQDHHADLAGGTRYVARQPILDQRGLVHGYELLFRSGPNAFFQGDGDLATRTMLDNAVMFGLAKLTGGLPAFLNCTAESLTEELVDILPSSMTILEILETLEPTPKLVESCRRLKALGFRIALDDFVWKPELEPLVKLADYIKVDFLLTNAAERKELLLRVKGATVALIAEKIETQEEYKKACAEGFTLFQGYYFCRPTLMKNQQIPANRISHIEILQMMRAYEIDFNKLTEAVTRDASLTYRLLRLVNSPVYAFREQVRSVRAALITVGEDTFRRVATLAITSELNAGQPVEILRMAFVRGRFCEIAAGLARMEPTEQYLLGLLSLLPAMLRLPMAQLTPLLPLRDEIREALNGIASPERKLLDWLEFQERGDWRACDAVIQRHGLNGEEMVKCYEEAVVWAEAALHSAL